MSNTHCKETDVSDPLYQGIGNIAINPKTTANFFSIIFFWWINKTLELGNKQPLQDDDLFPLLEEDDTQRLVECIATEWKEEVEVSHEKGTKPQLWKAVKRVIPAKAYVKLVVLSLLSSASFVGVLVLIWFFLRSLDDMSYIEYVASSRYILGIGILCLVRALTVHHAENFCEVWGMRLKVATTGLVYRKILVVTRHSLEKSSSKSTVNLVCNNAKKMEKCVVALGMFLSAQFEIIASACIFCLLIGWKALIGAVFFVIVVLYIVLIAGKLSEIETKVGSFTDARLALMNEIICGIRAVKMHALEMNFIESVKRLRRKEIRFLQIKSVILSSFMALRYTSTSIGALISFTVMILTGIQLQAFQIFTLLMGFNILKFAVCVNLADSIRYLVDVRIALTKAQLFLEHDTSYPRENVDNLQGRTGSSSFAKGADEAQQQDRYRRKRHMTFEDLESFKASGCALLRRRLLSNVTNPREKNRIAFSDFSCTWTEKPFRRALQNVSIEVDKNQLVVVTGPVGSGKSSLLLSVIEELPPSHGKLTSVGRIAYVSEIPWIFSGNVRENIVFGRPFNQYLYNQVLEACDLLKDLHRLPKGDMAKLGQHGANLSGGQRARISLARALYSEADIYLLDEPLSAVDSKVGKLLFERCICGMLSDRLRVVVTHQVQYLKAASFVVVLDRGSVKYQGSPKELENRQIMSKVPKIGRKMRWKSAYRIVRGGKAKKPLRRMSTMTGTLEVGREAVLEGLRDIQGLQGLQEADEDRKIGSVGFALYRDYFTSGLHPFWFTVLMMFFCLVQVSLVSPSWWLSRMADMSHDQQREPGTLIIYAALVIFAPLVTTLAAYCFYHTTLGAAKTLHGRMTEAVIKSPALFFDTNSVGRILNRFTRDIGFMDKVLPACFLKAVQIGMFACTASLVPVATNYWMALAVLPLLTLYLYYGRFYLRSSRELKRLEALKCSPLYSHISETVAGLETIRSCNAEGQFLRKFYRYQDENTQAFMMVVSTDRWIGLRLEILCAIYITAVAIGALVIGGSPAAVGLAMSFAMQILSSNECVVRAASEVENSMTSVERVLAYANLDPEPGYSVHTDTAEFWPQEGRLQLEKVTLEYIKGGVEVLKDITLDIAAKEKVGVVGRTGAGKSSIIAALFRMPDPKGKVLIDGIDIGTLNLQVARTAMTVITQDPVLFCGTLRKNLDPFNRFFDADLWAVLEQVQMKALVEDFPGELDYELKESGSNFSVGQRQLLCFARALLQKPKIIIMDEATANVDFQTDQMVQEIVRGQFEDCTVLTIAHRLHTVINYDKVLVLDKGHVVEFDKPDVLLKDRDGLFTQMAKTHNDTLAM